MSPRDTLIQRLRDKMMRMRAAFDRFDDNTAEAEMVGPKWNVRDLAGHMAFWTGEGADRLVEIAARSAAWASRRPPTGADGSLDETAENKAIEAALPPYDIEAINENVFRKNRRMSFVMLLAQLRAAEERFLERLARIDPQHFTGQTPLRRWIDIHLEHYDHHWRGLKAAAERQR